MVDLPAGWLATVLRCELRECLRIAKPTVTAQELNELSASFYMRSFSEDPRVYKAYLKAIAKPDYFVFFEEVPILAALAGINIRLFHKMNGNTVMQNFFPNPAMLPEGYVRAAVWPVREPVEIWHAASHFERYGQPLAVEESAAGVGMKRKRQAEADEDWAAQRLDASSDDEAEPVSPEFFNYDTLYKGCDALESHKKFPCDKSDYSLMSHYFGKRLLKHPAVRKIYLSALRENEIEREEDIADLKSRLFKDLKSALTAHLRSNYEIGGDISREVKKQISDFLTAILTRERLQHIRTRGIPELADLAERLYTKISLRHSKVIKKAFVDFINTDFTKIISTSFYRPTLPKVATLVVNSQTEFLAALNLSLRSSKNIQRNAQDTRYVAGLDLPIPFNMSFAGHVVSGTETYAKGAKHKRARRDEVTHFGTYSHIVDQAKFFEVNGKVERETLSDDEDDPEWFPGDDEVIHDTRKDDEDRSNYFAQDLREIIRCSGEGWLQPKWDDPRKYGQYMEFCHELIYLLFGCEASRNPAALIHHMMLLDLIEGEAKGYETWEAALLQKMPMSIEDACAASRYLHQEYGRCLGLPYNYPGPPLVGAKGHPTPSQQPTVNELIGREDRIVRDWLAYKEDHEDDFATTDSLESEGSEHTATTEEDQFLKDFQRIQRAIEKDWYPALFELSRELSASEHRSALVWSPALIARVLKSEAVVEADLEV